MSTDRSELVSKTPIYINGKRFDPAVCVSSSAHPDTPHQCVHDWRCYWGNQDRVETV